jgi:uncharacterized integral membrane protein (TIGR00697 family)
MNSRIKPYVTAAKERLPLMALMGLVALHAAMFVIQPMLSSLKTVNIFGILVLAGSLIRVLSCGLADVVNEVWGVGVARLNVVAAMFTRLLSWLVIGAIVILPGEVKDEAFMSSLFISFRLMGAGVLGLFLVEMWMDATLFAWMRKNLPFGFWFRSNLTNVLNHVIGSFLVLTLGFYGTGRPIVAVAVGGLFSKLALGFVLTPLFAGMVRVLGPLGKKPL